jgi:hypothetical protein
MMNHAVIDFRYLDVTTAVAKTQIRATLETEYHVPPEVIEWAFEEIDAREVALRAALRELEKTEYLL